MSRETLETFFFRKYDSSRTSVDADHQSLALGSRNQIITGAGKAQAFKGLPVKAGLEGSLVLMNAGEGYAGLGSFGDTDVKGSAFRILSALFFIGNGDLRYNGSAAIATAASILQIKLRESGAWSAATYQAGLSQPLAATIAIRSILGSGMSGKLKAGTYSVKITQIRSATGVRSLASLMSNVAVVEGTNGRSARITFPNIGANGADRWGIYVSARSFGSTGPHYFLQEVAESELTTIDGVARSYEIEWSDGNLVGSDLAPIDSYVPPSGIFAGVLGDTAFIAGCYSNVGESTVGADDPGSTIAVSLPLHPEEYPPDFQLYPPEAPTGLMRGGDGFYYYFGKSTMGVISYVGGEPALAFQLMWPNTGITYPHNAVVGTGGRVYAKSGNNLVRIGANGEPETEWAAPVADEMADLTDEKTVLGWDTSSHSLLVMHERLLWVYNEQRNAWGAPITSTELTGDFVASVTQSNRVIIAAKTTSAINLYDFNGGGGSVMVSMTDWKFSQAETDTLRQVDIVMRADSLNPVTMQIYKDENNTTPVMTTTIAVPKLGTAKLQSERFLLPDCQSFSVKLTQTTAGGDAGFEVVRVTGATRRIPT
jgi:hypothetical protein